MSRILMLSLFLAVVAIAKPDEPPAAKLNAVVPADSIAFVSLDAAALWEHKSFAAVREARGKLEFAWVVQSLFGVAPQEMERVTAFWHAAAPGEPFILLAGRKALDATKIAKLLERPGGKPVKPHSASAGDR